MLPETDRMLGLPELARRWGVSVLTLRRLITAGKLRAVRIGKSVRVPESAVLVFEREGAVQPA